MKRKNTLWSLVLALVMVLGVFAPLSALADMAVKETKGTIAAADISTTRPDKTNVTIHKLQADSYDSNKVPAKHNGGKLQEEQLKALGTNVKELDGVTFTCFKLKDGAQLELFEKTPDKYSTVDQVKAVEGVTEYKPDIVSEDGSVAAGAITTKDGKGVTVQIKDEGYYWFVESAKPDNVSSAIAVPFGISIPVTNPTDIVSNDDVTHDAGTVYLKNVHIYPKNVTGDLPKVDKDVKDLKQKKATYNVGEPVTWFITGDIPANLKEYKTYYLTDNLDKQLSYIGNVKVLYGTYADKEALKAEKKTIDGNANKTGILPANYYTLTEPAKDAKGGLLKLELTEAGRKALYSESDPKHKLYFYFETKINEDAIMGKEIENNVTLKFINTPDGVKEKEEKPTETPKVITGGKLFKKVEAGTDKELPGAVFTIKHQKDGTKPETKAAWDAIEDLKWTEDLIKANKVAIQDGKFATKAADKEVYTETSANNMPKAGTPIYLYSDATGNFEIKGLELSEYNQQTWNGAKLVDGTVVHNYYALKEVRAPKEYGLIDGYTPFEITETSYYKAETLKTATGTTAGDADPKKVENKKLTIPQTGGMGTMIFMVAGLALMGGAFVAMRKRSAEQA